MASKTKRKSSRHPRKVTSSSPSGPNVEGPQTEEDLLEDFRDLLSVIGVRVVADAVRPTVDSAASRALAASADVKKIADALAQGGRELRSSHDQWLRDSGEALDRLDAYDQKFFEKLNESFSSAQVVQSADDFKRSVETLQQGIVDVRSRQEGLEQVIASLQRSEDSLGEAVANVSQLHKSVELLCRDSEREREMLLTEVAALVTRNRDELLARVDAKTTVLASAINTQGASIKVIRDLAEKGAPLLGGLVAIFVFMMLVGLFGGC